MASENGMPFEEGDEELLVLDEDDFELSAEQRPQYAGPYGILLFDMTGSMQTLRSTGNTRCADAKVMANAAILDFFNPASVNGSGLAIWGFTNNGSASDDVVPLSTGYFGTAASAMAAINGISCNGSTPLADAMCKGVNGDGETLTLNPLPTRMLVLTDGYENTSNGVCAGPSGGTFTSGTWQNKVLMQLVARGVRVDARFWASPTILQQPRQIDDFTASADAGDAEARREAMLEELQLIADVEELPAAVADSLAAQVDVALTCDQACQELQFFSDAAAFSGGVFGVVSDTNTNYPAVGAVDPPGGPVPPPGSGGGGWW